jgi:hypothetical protein
MTVTAGQLAHAVHANVVAGTYPDSDDVYSASLPSDALPEIIAHLEKAREEVNVCAAHCRHYCCRNSPLEPLC